VRDDLAELEAGLDALDASAEAPPTGAAGCCRRAGRRWSPLALLLGVWELAYRAGLKPAYALPVAGGRRAHPRRAAARRDAARGDGVSLSRGGLGFLAALAIGTPLGLLIAGCTRCAAASGPLVSGCRACRRWPGCPAAIIFFGIGNTAIYAVVLLGAVPSIANGMVSGIDQVPAAVPPGRHGARCARLDMARHVLLPAALPGTSRHARD
jgi:NitT/TauT family transport system permease protein